MPPAIRPAAFELRCIVCGASTQAPAADFRCESCQNLLEVSYPERTATRPAAALDAAALKSVWAARKSSLEPVDQSGVGRFRELLPVLADFPRMVTLREGNTPIYEMPRCAAAVGVQRLLAKHQGMNPTGSFKDTGMTVALSVAREKGFAWVGCASTGNTSASMAAYAARAGMKALVLVPEGKIAWGKLAQALDYGALTCQLKTDFDGCVRVLSQVMQRFSLALLNSVNPFRIEGQKTAAFEMLEQLAWRVPDHVIVPGGNLGNSSALGKGLQELKAMGFINRLPRLSIIQAAGANPLVRSMRESQGERLTPVHAETRATAIQIGNPASWKKAVAVLRASGGACEEVSDAEIAVAKSMIGGEGVGCEPASAATLAGLKKLVRSGFVERDELVVLVLTGHLLKDAQATLDFHGVGAEGSGEAGGEGAGGTGGVPRRTALVTLEPDADAVVRMLEGSLAG